LHPEGIVGNPKVVGTHDQEISTGKLASRKRLVGHCWRVCGY